MLRHYPTRLMFSHITSSTHWIKKYRVVLQTRRKSNNRVFYLYSINGSRSETTFFSRHIWFYEETCCTRSVKHPKDWTLDVSLLTTTKLTTPWQDNKKFFFFLFRFCCYLSEKKKNKKKTLSNSLKKHQFCVTPSEDRSRTVCLLSILLCGNVPQKRSNFFFFFTHCGGAIMVRWRV